MSLSTKLKKSSFGSCESFYIKYGILCKWGTMKAIVFNVQSMQIPDIDNDTKSVPTVMGTCTKCGFSAFWNQRIVLGE